MIVATKREARALARRLSRSTGGGVALAGFARTGQVASYGDLWAEMREIVWQAPRDSAAEVGDECRGLRFWIHDNVEMAS